MEIGLKSNRVALFVPSSTEILHQQTLYILFQESRWSAAVVDDQGKVIGFEEFMFSFPKPDEEWKLHIEEWEKDSFLFGLPYKNIIYTYLPTFVLGFPKQFVNLTEDNQKIISFFPKANYFRDKIWKIDSLEALDLVYYIPQLLHKQLQKKFDTIEHQSIWKNFEFFLETNKKYQVFLWVADHYFGLILFENNQLKGMNTFEYFLEDDIYYHVFNLCSQLGIPYHKTHLKIFYQTSHFLKLFTFFETYFEQVQEQIVIQNLSFHECISAAIVKNNQCLFQMGIKKI